MNTNTLYDTAIIGGGLSGLCLAIQLSEAGHSVILFEKEKYPFHKVCGEYLSMESWNFLEEMGVPLNEWHQPRITNLLVSSPSGKIIHRPLDPGGFGISRYKLDAFLASMARKAGVEIMEGTKVENVVNNNTYFEVYYADNCCKAKLVCGAFGKRSNLDIKLKRAFTRNKPAKSNNYIAVKYHIKTIFPKDRIALHNFENGYCGISAIDDNTHCLCYLTSATNLQRCDNTIASMEQKILFRNPHLEKIFRESEFLYSSPLTISQISFSPKAQSEQHIVMTGDAAGMIPPLSGNGMSMAMHGSKIAFQHIHHFLKGKTNRTEMEAAYENQWREIFHKRINTGRWIQQWFGKTWVTEAFIRILKPFPMVTDRLIRQTHGSSF